MKYGYLCKIIPAIAGLIIIIEGSLIFSFAGRATIDGIGSVMKSTVQLGGLQLMIIGLLTLAGSTFILYFISERGRIGLIRRILRIVVAAMGLVVVAEGIVLAFMGSKTIIEGYGTLEAYIVAVFAAQLFFLGMAILIPAILQKNEIGLIKLMVYAGGSATASAGLSVIGVAASTYIGGIGWILPRTVEIAGGQLFLLGIVIVLISLLMDMITKFRAVLSILRYFVTFVVVIEGLVLISLATQVDIEGIGWITSRTLILSGFALTLTGLFTLFVTGLRTQRVTPRLRRMTIASVFMLTLLIPMAALTFGHIF
jgi:hypothetical protein